MDISKPLPPGRRASSKREKFQGGTTIDGIEYDVNGVRIKRDDGAAEEKRAREQEEALAVETAAREMAVAQAAREEQEREERIQREENAARLEAIRLQREEEALQRQRQQEEEEVAAAAAQQQVEEEQRRIRKQEIAIAKAAEEERRQQEEAAVLEEQRVRFEAEQAQRKAAAEARAEQQRIAREQELEEERKRAEEEEAELNAAIASEKSRREALRLEEETRRRQEAEAEALEERRLRDLRIAEANAAASAALSAEDSALAEKRRRAEEQRKKRAMFLSDMDSFSGNFEVQAANQQAEREAAAQREKELLQEGVQNASTGFVAPAYKVAADEDEEKVEAPVRNVNPAPAPVAAPIVAPMIAQERAIKLGDSSGQGGQFGDLASSLFATGASGNAVAVNVDAAVDASDELRSATRIGGRKETHGATASAPSAASALPPVPAPVPAVATGFAPSTTGVQSTTSVAATATPLAFNPDLLDDDDDDDEEEGGAAGTLSNFLTREERMTMSATEKASWRAKHGDLSKRRHEFHGAVTFAFDGIFSWQMYGSAEAIDESGRAYTEYLMRCQWGTTWENLQPWISARRYREFDILDAQLRQAYPAFAHSLLSLPQKDFFRALESNVVQKRRAALEDYMAKIIGSLPSILRSEQLNEFLGIGERIAAIRKKLHIEERTLMSQAQHIEQEQLAQQGRRPAALEPASQEDENELTILTPEAAEAVREETDARSLDEDELGHLEEDVKDLCLALRDATPKTAAAKGPIRELVKACSDRWPRLRATTVLGAGVDFSLIPRAMQAEEDLTLAINEFKSLRTAHSMF